MTGGIDQDCTRDAYNLKCLAENAGPFKTREPRGLYKSRNKQVAVLEIVRSMF